MAFVRGRDGQVTFGGTAVGQLKSWSLDYSLNLTDVSTMSVGATAGPYLPSQYATSYSVSGQLTAFLDADSVSPALGATHIASFNSITAASLTAGGTGNLTSIVIYPESGESITLSKCYITQSSLSSSVDGLVEITISFVADGSGTVTNLA